jgi:hypothetical protein
MSMKHEKLSSVRRCAFARRRFFWLLPAVFLLATTLRAQVAVFEQPCEGPPACSFHLEVHAGGGGPKLAELDFVPPEAQPCGTQRVDVSSILSGLEPGSARPPQLQVWSVGCTGTYSLDADWVLVESDPTCDGVTRSSNDGRVNNDGSVDISDAVRILMYLFGKAPRPCVNAADVNNDGVVDLSDAICVVNMLFGQSPCGSP